MPSAEIITIGTELLLGEIQDTNTRYLAKQLKEINVDLFRITMIGDNAVRIAEAINGALSRADIVITTGGLGPTVDDPTRDAVALAFQTQTLFHPELWQEIEQRFLKRSLVPTENNRRQAFLPIGADVIHNPVGTAPAFSMSRGNKLVISLPGVPREMETLTETEVIPLLKKKYQLQGIIKARVIHLAGIGESVVDAAIGEFEKMSNPTVGLLAHPGIVDIRITSKANSLAEANRLIGDVEKQIVALFPGKIFGYDDESLLKGVDRLLSEQNRTLAIQCFGLNDFWPDELVKGSVKSIRLVQLESPQTLLQNQYDPSKYGKIQGDARYIQTAEEGRMEFSLLSPQKVIKFNNIYNGPQSQGPTWAINNLFESVRQLLIENKQKGIE
jgi:competence/damage-inducible protein CinA-like protein